MEFRQINGRRVLVKGERGAKGRRKFLFGVQVFEGIHLPFRWAREWLESNSTAAIGETIFSAAGPDGEAKGNGHSTDGK